MAYMLIIDSKNSIVEIHSDLCDEVFKKKDNIFSEYFEFIPFNFFEEIEEFLKKHESLEVKYCEICAPKENRETLDEDYDDFYEEFDEDDELDDIRCDII